MKEGKKNIIVIGTIDTPLIAHSIEDIDLSHVANNLIEETHMEIKNYHEDLLKHEILPKDGRQRRRERRCNQRKNK